MKQDMRHMLTNKRFLISFFSALFIIFLIQGRSVAQPTDLLARSRQLLSRIKDYTAEGTMKTNVTFLKVPVSKVNVFYKKPDRIKIKSEKGISFIPRGAVSLNISSLLEGNDFDVVGGGDIIYKGKNLTIARLLPRSEDNPVIISQLYVDLQTGLVHKARTTTKENGTYELDFTYGKYASQGLPDQILFSFDARDYKLPKGITFDFDDGIGKKSVTDKAKKGRGTALLVLSKYVINAGLPDSVFN